MFDTLGLRIHAINERKTSTLQKISQQNNGTSPYLVPEHNDLYKVISKWKGKYFFMQKAVVRNQVQYSDLSEDEFLANTLNYHERSSQTMMFIDEDRVKEFTMSVNGNFRIPSSYNAVTYRINERKGFIDMQLSIPKYLFGHSLAQFIPQINNDDYIYSNKEATTWNFQAKLLYKRLNDFIDLFLNDIANHFRLEAMPNKKYIEIRRIDLCYNQYFDSKVDAFRYLDHLRIKNHGRYKSNQKAPRDYNTSIEYHSSTGAYSKVYHKGTEYTMSKDGDFKKHSDVNKEWSDKVFNRLIQKAKKQRNKEDLELIYDTKKNLLDIFQRMSRGEFNSKYYSPRQRRFIKRLYASMPYKIDFIKRETDKILRFEISFKGDFFTYYYKSKVFRRNCEYHNNAYIHYKKAKSKLDSRNASNHILNTREHHNYKMMSAFLNRKAFLFLDTNRYIKQWEKTGHLDYDSKRSRYTISKFGLNNTILQGHDVGTFSEYFLKWMVKYFKSFVDGYHVETLHPDDNLEDRVHNYNLEVDKNLELYNKAHTHLLYNSDGSPVKKRGKIVTKASELLSEREKSELHLKKIRPFIILAINEQLKKKKDFLQIRKRLNISNSQWCKYKRDLDNLGITENHTISATPIPTRKDWSTYYEKLENIHYFNSFYSKKNHAYY